jgi:hypothetical protein
MSRPSDYFLSFYQPINDKMAYKEIVGIKPETPFVGVAYQLVKLLEDFYFAFANVFKRSKHNDKNLTTAEYLSQTKILNAIKMVVLSALYLITHVFLPAIKLMSSNTYRAAFIAQNFQGKTPLKTIGINIVYWLSNTLDITLNLVRGVALIAFAIPVVITSPIRFLFDPADEQQALEGRKVSGALTQLKNTLKKPDATETEKLMGLMNFMHFFKRRIDSGHLSIPQALKDNLIEISGYIKNGQEAFKDFNLDFQDSTIIKIENPVKSETLGGEKQLSLGLATSLDRLVDAGVREKSEEDLKNLIQSQIESVFPPAG